MQTRTSKQFHPKKVLATQSQATNTFQRSNQNESGRGRNRTGDLVHAKHTRYQLRHTPELMSETSSIESLTRI